MKEAHIIDVTHMACAPRQVLPALREFLFYFALLHNTLIYSAPEGNKPHHILALICFSPIVEHNVAF